MRPLPGAKADWEIISEIARRMGHKWSYASPQEIFLEIAQQNPFYAGLTWQGLKPRGIRTQEQEVARA
jgi:NADH-quinone oxidoreductase subunit G